MSQLIELLALSHGRLEKACVDNLVDESDYERHIPLDEFEPASPVVPKANVVA